MRNNLTWTFFLILSCASVWPLPMQTLMHAGRTGADDPSTSAQPGDPVEPSHEQVISVRITSSVAVARGKGKLNRLLENKQDAPSSTFPTSPGTENISISATERSKEANEFMTTMRPDLTGANMEFIKQLHSKKEARGFQHFERVHSFPSDIVNQYSNDTDDSVAESSVTSVLEVGLKDDETGERIENIPLARSVPLSTSSNNYIQGPSRKPISEWGNNQRLTTVSFNVVHDTPKVTKNYESSDTFVAPETPVAETPRYYNEQLKFFNEPAKVYSQPAQVYSEPAKYYSEPAKIYSEPAKNYGEPAKIYSEPAKVYSEPARFYSQPASLHLPPDPTNRSPWQRLSAQNTTGSSTVGTTTPITTIVISSMLPNKPSISEHQPEKNYEVDEKISVQTDGRSHGVQESSTESCKQENCKVGYVVEGRQYRKYRVEERTADGFIVGEYGVVRNEDGALRGVRYTADGDASPRLIYDALMKFLQLK